MSEHSGMDALQQPQGLIAHSPNHHTILYRLDPDTVSFVVLEFDAEGKARAEALAETHNTGVQDVIEVIVARALGGDDPVPTEGAVV